jgi:predicted transcriptional regulator
MSTHKRTTTTPTGRPALRTVPPATITPVRTDTQNHLWAALKGRSDSSTTAELAIAAGIGRSTAGKILAEWAKDGTVARTPGGLANGRRTPDRWAITAPADLATSGDDTADPVVETNAAKSPDEKSGTSTRADRADPIVVATPVDGDLYEEATADTGRAVPADQAAGADTSGTNEKDNLDAATGTLAATDTTPRRTVADGNDEPRRGEPVPGAKSPRLQSGALRGLVEDYLHDHPADASGPGAIGKALNRSAGAVNNALEKLVEIGYAQRVQDTPKRFQFNASPESPAT